MLANILTPKRPRNPAYEFDIEVEADPEHLVVLNFGGDVDGDIWPVSCEITGFECSMKEAVSRIGQEAFDRAIAAAEDW